jgi:hypothetical protein
MPKPWEAAALMFEDGEYGTEWDALWNDVEPSELEFGIVDGGEDGLCVFVRPIGVDDWDQEIPLSWVESNLPEDLWDQVMESTFVSRFQAGVDELVQLAAGAGLRHNPAMDDIMERTLGVSVSPPVEFEDPWVTAVARVLGAVPSMTVENLAGDILRRSRSVSMPPDRGRLPSVADPYMIDRERANREVALALHRGPFVEGNGVYLLEHGVTPDGNQPVVLHRERDNRGFRRMLVFDHPDLADEAGADEFLQHVSEALGEPLAWSPDSPRLAALMMAIEDVLDLTGGGAMTAQQIFDALVSRGQLMPSEEDPLTLFRAALGQMQEDGRLQVIDGAEGGHQTLATRYRLPREEPSLALPTTTLELGVLVDTVVAGTGVSHDEARHRLRQTRFLMIDGQVRRVVEVSDLLECSEEVAAVVLTVDPAYIVVPGGYQWGAELHREARDSSPPLGTPGEALVQELNGAPLAMLVTAVGLTVDREPGLTTSEIVDRFVSGGLLEVAGVTRETLEARIIEAMHLNTGIVGWPDDGGRGPIRWRMRDEASQVWVAVVSRILRSSVYPDEMTAVAVQEAVWSRCQLLERVSGRVEPVSIPLGASHRELVERGVSRALRGGAFEGPLPNMCFRIRPEDLDPFGSEPSGRVVLTRSLSQILVFDGEFGADGSESEVGELLTGVLLELGNGEALTAEGVHERAIQRIPGGQFLNIDIVTATLERLSAEGQVMESGSMPTAYRLPQQEGQTPNPMGTGLVLSTLQRMDGGSGLTAEQVRNALGDDVSPGMSVMECLVHLVDRGLALQLATGPITYRAITNMDRAVYRVVLEQGPEGATVDDIRSQLQTSESVSVSRAHAQRLLDGLLGVGAMALERTEDRYRTVIEMDEGELEDQAEGLADLTFGEYHTAAVRRDLESLILQALESRGEPLHNGEIASQLRSWGLRDYTSEQVQEVCVRLLHEGRLRALTIEGRERWQLIPARDLRRHRRAIDFGQLYGRRADEVAADLRAMRGIDALRNILSRRDLTLPQLVAALHLEGDETAEDRIQRVLCDNPEFLVDASGRWRMTAGAKTVEDRIVELFVRGTEILTYGDIADALGEPSVEDSVMHDVLQELIKAGVLIFLSDQYSSGYRLVRRPGGDRPSALDRLIAIYDLV